MMKKLFAVLLLMLLASSARAGGTQQKTFFLDYDLNATSYVYQVYGDEIQGRGFIATVGSSTTVTASNGTPFAGLAAGYEITVNLDGVETRRTISTWTSTTSIVVNTAINLSAQSGGYRFSWRSVTNGTATTNGWVPTGHLKNMDVVVVFTTLTGTDGVDVSVECRGLGDATTPLQVLTGNYSGTTAPTNGDWLPVLEGCASVRVGLKWRTADTAGTDVISAFLRGEER